MMRDENRVMMALNIMKGDWLHVQYENWATIDFLSTIFSELLNTTEFLTTTVYSYRPEKSSTTEFMDIHFQT